MLESLRRQTFRDFRVYLIDDASTDDSPAQLRAALQPGDVFLPQARNLGLRRPTTWASAAHGRTARDAVLLLNNDTACAPDLLEQLLRHTPPGAVSLPQNAVYGPAGRDLVRRRHAGPPPLHCHP